MVLLFDIIIIIIIVFLVDCLFYRLYIYIVRVFTKLQFVAKIKKLKNNDIIIYIVVSNKI